MREKRLLRIIAFILACFTVISLVSCSPQNGGEGTTAASSIENVTPSEAEPTETAAPETKTDTETDAETEAPEIPEVKPRPDALDKDKTYNILFIGNSCTSVNDIPNTLFPRIARSAGYTVYVERVVKGGWYLDGHANPEDEAGAKVAAALAKQKWDYVVIQEQVRGFVENPVRFYDGARELVAKIRENGAIPILYSTWSYNRGHSYLDQHKLTYKKKAYTIAGHCEAIGKELGIEVAYVGLAFLQVDGKYGSIDDFYSEDKVHTSVLGSNLAALTIFATIFNVDPSIPLSPTNTEKTPRASPIRNNYIKEINYV